MGILKLNHPVVHEYQLEVGYWILDTGYWMLDAGYCRVPMDARIPGVEYIGWRMFDF